MRTSIELARFDLTEFANTIFIAIVMSLCFVNKEMELMHCELHYDMAITFVGLFPSAVARGWDSNGSKIYVC